MCGICGVLKKGGHSVATESTLSKMLSNIRHRGPDDQGTYLSDNEDVGMGATRLSIVDIAGGSQPIFNEDGSVAVVFNGEIYNHLQLRGELKSRGHQFRTDCDTEILVHLWEEYGKEMPTFLNGMFAFSIWDSNQNQLFLARDRLGIKPLYFSNGGNEFVWSSEIPAILSTGINRDVSRSSVYNYLNFAYSPWPQTLFKNIKKLRPGSSLLISEDTFSIDNYWELSPDEVPDDLDEISSKVREYLESAVECRLMSDVPVGAFLSGGLDSTSIVALMDELSDEEIKTFSISFKNSEFDESREARFVANHFDTDHHEVEVNLSSMNDFSRVIRHFGDPLSDPAILPTYLLSEYASNSVKVVMTGEGSDELFAGYAPYNTAASHRRLVDRLPSQAFEIADVVSSRIPKGKVYFDYLSSLRDDREVYLNIKRGLSETYDVDDYIKSDGIANGPKEVLQKEVPEPMTEGETPLKSLTTFKIRSNLCDGLLHKVDRSSMAASLEARVPFLDHRLVEYAYGIPDKFKKRETKLVLKRAVNDIVPDRILERKKHHFDVPVEHWLRSDNEAITGWLSTDKVDAAPYIDAPRVRELFNEHREKKADNSALLWRILTYVAWYHTFAIGKVPAARCN